LPAPRRFLALALLGLLSHSTAFAAPPAPVQSRESYEAAFATISTSPSYVLVSIGDGDTAPTRPVCITANFLRGALHHEYALGYGREDLLKADRIALEHQDHVFRFHDKGALDKVRARYTEADLAAARALLAPLPDDEVKAKFSSLYAKDRLPTKGCVTDALACALIERGFSPKMADLSGQVYIER
jgi:hypothetical protein